MSQSMRAAAAWTAPCPGVARPLPAETKLSRRRFSVKSAASSRLGRVALGGGDEGGAAGPLRDAVDVGAGFEKTLEDVRVAAGGGGRERGVARSGRASVRVGAARKKEIHERDVPALRRQRQRVVARQAMPGRTVQALLR